MIYDKIKLRTAVAACFILLFLTGCTKQVPTPGTSYFDNKKMQAQISVDQGVEYLAAGDTSRAATSIKKSLKQDAQIPSPWYTMGYYLEKTHQYHAAEQYYKKAIEIAPRAGETHNNYASFLCRQHRYSECLRQLMLAISTHYNDIATAYQNAALAFLAIHEAYEAKHYFLLALQHNPRQSRSLLARTSLDAHQGKLNRAK